MFQLLENVTLMWCMYLVKVLWNFGLSFFSRQGLGQGILCKRFFCARNFNDVENVGGGRSFPGVDRLGHVDRDGQKRGITTCRVASDALASDVKAYDAGQIQVLVQIPLTLSKGLKWGLCASFRISNHLCSCLLSQISAVL